MTEPSLQPNDPADEPDSCCDPFVALDAETDEPPDVPWLREGLRTVCRELGLGCGGLNVVIIGDEKMTDFNRRFCRVDGTTDVLAFDLRQDPEATAGTPETIDGELYLCLDEASRCAARFGHPLNHELLLYATHGLLHLIGYDDQDAEGRRRMHEREDELLSTVGVGPVYARAAAAATDGGNQP